MVTLLVGSTPFASASLRKLPPTTLYTLQGEEKSLPSSSWAVLYFFPPDCWSCFTEIAKLHNQIQGERDLLFFPICIDCDWKKMKNLHDSFAENIKLYFLPSLEQAILGIWGKTTVFLVSPSGKVVRRWDRPQINVEEIKGLLASATYSPRSSEKKLKPSCSSTLCE